MWDFRGYQKLSEDKPAFPKPPEFLNDPFVFVSAKTKAFAKLVFPKVFLDTIRQNLAIVNDGATPVFASHKFPDVIHRWSFLNVPRPYKSREVVPAYRNVGIWRIQLVGHIPIVPFLRPNLEWWASTNTAHRSECFAGLWLVP